MRPWRGDASSGTVTNTVEFVSCEVGQWILLSRSALVLKMKSLSKESLNCGPDGRNVSNLYVGAWINCLDSG